MTRAMQNGPRRSTNLTPWSPVDDPYHRYKKLRRLLRILANIIDSPDPALIPFADSEETDDADIIELAVPGISKQDVTIEAGDPQVSLRGGLKQRGRAGILRRQIRLVGRVNSEVVPPSDVEEAGASARWGNSGDRDDGGGRVLSFVSRRPARSPLGAPGDDRDEVPGGPETAA